MKYRATWNKGKAARVMDDEKAADFEESRYGFYWWFWLPRVHHNTGKFSRNEVVDMSVNWLCFWVGICFWPNKSK